MSKVYANSRSILHAKDGLTQIAPCPDVCKTSTPGGPVPMPYPNQSRDARLSGGSKRTTIRGGSIAIAGSCLADSFGDEPGALGGVISNKNRGKLGFQNCSRDVKVEGKGVVRFGDQGLGNGNGYNTSYPLMQGIASPVSYGDDARWDGDCPRCGQPRAEHRVLVTDGVVAAMDMLLQQMGELVEQAVLAEIETRGEALRAARAAASSAGSPKQAKRTQKYLGRLEREFESFTTTCRGRGLMVQVDEDFRSISTGPALQSIPFNKMYGVVICRCEGHLFCALSGTAAQTFQLGQGNVLNDSTLLVEAVKKLNESKALGKKWYTADSNAAPTTLHGYPGPKEPSSGRPHAVGTLTGAPREMSMSLGNGEEYRQDSMLDTNTPGECAAPKALDLCVREGHVAMSLVEVWYAGKKDRPVATRPITSGAGEGPARPPRSTSGTNRGDPDKGVTPHCNTCQNLIPLMMCYRKDTPCSG